MRSDLGFARNPFESWGDEAHRRVFELPQTILRWAEAGRRLAQLVGAVGMGKSTHLRAIEALAGDRGESCRYQRLSAGDSPPEPPPTAWWLLDESQWLAPADLRRVVAAALEAGGRVVLATHRDHRKELRGATVPVQTFVLRGLRTRAEVADFWRRCLVASGAEPTDFPLRPPAAARMRRLAAGNIEVIQRLGYEIFEDLDRPRPIEADDVVAAAAQLETDAPGFLHWRRREREHRR